MYQDVGFFKGNMCLGTERFLSNSKSLVKDNQLLKLLEVNHPKNISPSIFPAIIFLQ